MKLIKQIFSGLIGAGLFFLISIILFAVLKVIYIIGSMDLLLSKYNIGAVIILFMIIGFIAGIISFDKKTRLFKLFKLTWLNFFMDIILSVIFTFIVYLILRYAYHITTTFSTMILLFLILVVLLYAFSAVLSNYYTATPQMLAKHRGRNAFLMIITNPVFVIIFLWLFSLIIYNSMYIPCGVAVVGIDKNPNTVTTAYQEIPYGERILSIDGQKMNSLQDVKRFMASLPATKEVAIETENRIYYIKTYMDDGQRYMGLMLAEATCQRKY